MTKEKKQGITAPKKTWGGRWFPHAWFFMAIFAVN